MTQLADDTDEIVEETGEPQDIEQQDDIQEQTPEEQARIQGWRPKEEYKGDPDKWVSAEDFLKAGQERLPMLQQHNKRLAEVNRDLTKKTKSLEKMIETMKGFEKRAYERAKAELEARHDEAVESGDVKAGRAVLQEMRALEADAAQRTVEPEDKPDMTAVGNKITEWIEESDWYHVDPEKTKYADMLADRLGPPHEHPEGVDGWLAEMEEKVTRKFTPKKPAMVSGAGNRAPAKKTGGWADLTAEEKAMGQRFADMKVMTREEYAAQILAAR